MIASNLLQPAVLQFRSSSSGPLKAASGSSLQALILVCLPPPHDFEHSDQSSQLLKNLIEFEQMM